MLHDEVAELLVVLKHSTMSGVRVDRKRTARNAAVQVLGQDRGHHPVVVTIGDQGGGGNHREVLRGRCPQAWIAASCAWKARTVMG